MEKSKLTAYALNEVNEAERAEIERYLETHPVERAEVEEIKLVSAILKSELASELVVRAPELGKKKAFSFSVLWRPRTLGLAVSLGFIGLISMHLVKEKAYTPTVNDPSSRTLGSGTVVVKGDMIEKSEFSGALESKQKRLALDPLRGGGRENELAPPIDVMSASEPSTAEEYKLNEENDFLSVTSEPLSTFSIDVDTASYANTRRYLNSYNQIPPVDAIRTEEFINYFDYDYSAPTTGHPIAVHLEATKSPWHADKILVRVGLKAKEMNEKDRPKSNLVFLIDVSGSMEDERKLPLVKSALTTLTEQLKDYDRISMVVYAGQSGVILDSESGSHKDKIVSAIQKLSSGGGTNGEGGIRKAYEIAQKNYISGGNNRVILATDGDFNVGVTSNAELLKIIKEKSEGGIYMTALGFGMGNYKDSRMEEISNKGQGNYFYIDTAKEADKIFVNQLMGTLFTIAKDVKVQVEFNPSQVKSYRLVGYENRMLKKEDFNNDKIDAGEMGAGHSVTALYEIDTKASPNSQGLKYAAKEEKKSEVASDLSDEILTVKIRYKKPQNSSSEYFEQALKNNVASLEKASCATRFAIAVASFSQWLRKSDHVKGFDAARIGEISKGCLTTRDRDDQFKLEFLELVKKAREIKN